MRKLKPYNREKIIKRVLVACQGAMAGNVCQEAERLRLIPFTIYSFADRYASHRFQSTESYQLGLEEGQENPYEDIEVIIKAAMDFQADAVYPDEMSPSFVSILAKRCLEEGLVFIGAPPELLSLQEDKQLLKVVAEELKIPFLPHPSTDEENLFVALRIGWKSVEVPIIADGFGEVFIFKELDCSIQKNGQPMLVITPAAHLAIPLRNQLFDFSLKIAKKLHWRQYGTLKFLVNEEGKLFLYGIRFGMKKLDSVVAVNSNISIPRCQLMIALGASLFDIGFRKQSAIKQQIKSTAMFCRVLAQDPENNFQGVGGRIHDYLLSGGEGISFDEACLYPGKEVSADVVSEITSVVAVGKTFRGAVSRLLASIQGTQIHGIHTNLKFLENLLKQEDFVQGNFYLDFIDRHPDLKNYESTEDGQISVLKYLAEIKINGHPDIGKRPKPQAKVPEVPAYNSFEQFPEGYKKILEEQGREELVRGMLNTGHTLFTDTTFREAQQSLWATRLRTEDMLAIAESYARNLFGLFAMEVWGAGAFESALRFLHEDPWIRLKKLRNAMPNMLLKATIDGATLLGYQQQPPKIIYKFLDKAGQDGVDIFRLLDTFNSPETMERAIRHIEKHSSALTEASIGYSGNLLSENQPRNLQFYLDNAKRLENMGAHLLSIKDGSGLMTPGEATVLFRALKKHISIPVSLNTHNTSGIHLLTCVKAMEAGVNSIDVSTLGRSGTLTQPDLHTLLTLLKDSGKATSIETGILQGFSDYWTALRPYYKTYEAESASSDAHRYKVPGSQYANLKYQAESMRLSEDFEEVKKRYREIHDLFGGGAYSGAVQKAMGDMALYLVANGFTVNDILQRAKKQPLPHSVIDLLCGKAGFPANGFPADIKTMVLGNTQIPAPKETDFKIETDFIRFQKQFPEVGFRDYLSFKMYPGIYQAYYQNKELKKDVSRLPTSAFFYPLTTGESITMETEEGKIQYIKLSYVSRADNFGFRSVFFERNGYKHIIKVKDRSFFPPKQQHAKAAKESTELGSPFPGRLIALFVREGDKVATGNPLFIVEAMKMEATVKAPFDGTVCRIALPVGAELEQNDLVICLG